MVPDGTQLAWAGSITVETTPLYLSRSIAGRRETGVREPFVTFKTRISVN
jgi:hypothetical protein